MRTIDRTASLEQRVMDLWDSGLSREQFAPIVAREFDCTKRHVLNVFDYMREGPRDRFAGSIVKATDALAARILAVHGPGAAA